MQSRDQSGQKESQLVRSTHLLLLREVASKHTSNFEGKKNLQLLSLEA
jgi:hypothetical protein